VRARCRAHAEITGSVAGDQRLSGICDHSLSVDADRWYCKCMASLCLKAVYDDEARVWTVSDDMLGLVAEADTVELLEYKLQELIPELVELNAIDLPRLTARRA